MRVLAFCSSKWKPSPNSALWILCSTCAQIGMYQVCITDSLHLTQSDAKHRRVC